MMPFNLMFQLIVFDLLDKINDPDSEGMTLYERWTAADRGIKVSFSCAVFLYFFTQSFIKQIIGVVYTALQKNLSRLIYQIGILNTEIQLKKIIYLP